MPNTNTSTKKCFLYVLNFSMFVLLAGLLPGCHTCHDEVCKKEYGSGNPKSVLNNKQLTQQDREIASSLASNAINRLNYVVTVVNNTDYAIDLEGRDYQTLLNFVRQAKTSVGQLEYELILLHSQNESVDDQ